jgi:AraC-like DNA-binding protein
VACLWTLDGHPASIEAGQPVMPDGRPEIVLHLGEPFERRAVDGAWQRQPALIFAGQLTEALSLRPTGRAAVLGIRLQPHGAAALMRVPQHQTAGAVIELSALDRGLADGLVEAVSGHALDEAVAAVTRVLRARLSPAAIDPRLHAVVGLVEQHRGAVSSSRLAAAVNLTPRQLERLFAAGVGLSPKRLARIVRFRHALARMEGSTDARGADVAAACGYADQAHFVREFRDIAGYTPGAHVLHRAELTGLFAAQDRTDPPQEGFRHR